LSPAGAAALPAQAPTPGEEHPPRLLLINGPPAAALPWPSVRCRTPGAPRRGPVLQRRNRGTWPSPVPEPPGHNLLIAQRQHGFHQL